LLQTIGETEEDNLPGGGLTVEISPVSFPDPSAVPVHAQGWEAPEYDLVLPDARYKSCPILDNRLGRNATLRPRDVLGQSWQALCLW
jgi:hypothetical protein